MTRTQIIDSALNENPGSDALAIFVTGELAETYEPDCNENTQLHN